MEDPGSILTAQNGEEGDAPVRIAFLPDGKSANAMYRSIGPMRALAQRGHDVRQLDTADTRGWGRSCVGANCCIYIVYATPARSSLLVLAARLEQRWSGTTMTMSPGFRDMS